MGIIIMENIFVLIAVARLGLSRMNTMVKRDLVALDAIKYFQTILTGDDTGVRSIVPWGK